VNRIGSSAAEQFQGKLPEIIRHLVQHAAEVDQEASFPTESLAVLRASGLFGLLVPVEYGGLGGNLADLKALAGDLAGGCLSTALIWAMHCQQVDSLVRYASDRLKAEVLPRIAAGELYLASVTTERSTGADLLTAEAALSGSADSIRLERDAPIVTGGELADGFLITMRDSEEAGANRVSLVYADRSQLKIEVSSRWDSLGMRGTRSVGLKITGDLPEHQIIGERGQYRTVAVESMIPAAHIGWAACWLGAARTAFGQVVGLIRSPRRPRSLDPDSPLTAVRLARARADLEVTTCYLTQVTREVVDLRSRGASLGTPEAQIHLNTLKIVAAEKSFAVVNELVELVGLATGYLRSSPLPLERNLRDLRSASLNFANDRLLVMNGALVLLDRAVRLA
jgi:acyl-CoA dehydrogenase